MKQPTLEACRTTAIRVALALVCCCTGLEAANRVTASPASVALTCNTATGPGAAATVVLKPVTALTTTSLTVALGRLCSLGPAVWGTPLPHARPFLVEWDGRAWRCPAWPAPG